MNNNEYDNEMNMENTSIQDNNEPKIEKPSSDTTNFILVSDTQNNPIEAATEDTNRSYDADKAYVQQNDSYQTQNTDAQPSYSGRAYEDYSQSQSNNMNSASYYDNTSMGADTSNSAGYNAYNTQPQNAAQYTNPTHQPSSYSSTSMQNGGYSPYNGYSSASTNRQYSAPTNQQYGNTSSAPTGQQYSNSYTQSYNTQTYATSTEKPKKKKEKKKRTFSMKAVVACIIITALICSGLSTAIGYLAIKDSLSTAQSGNSQNGASSSKTPTTNITVTGESEGLISAVAEKCSPSVVGIRVTTASSGYYLFGSSDSSSEGSGVIYTEDGYIITNYHVISTAVQQSTGSNYYYGFGFGGIQQAPTSSVVEVYLPDDSETAIPAQVVGYDVTSDLAVLKIDRTGLPAIEIADSDSVKVGDRAIAIGNPGGLEFMGSVSAGIISGLDRSLSTENGIVMSLIQTDAAINPGNSGGALVNSVGKLIGINNSKITGNGFEGMGFSIPSNHVVEICNRLIRQENEPTAYLGVTIDTSYSSSILNRMGYPSGVVVFTVAEGSPAEQAGIRQYDVITAINGTAITSYEQLNSEKNRYSPGETITITVYRNGNSYNVDVTLGSTGSASGNSQ